MQIKRPSKWEMYCPYCKEDLLLDNTDFYWKFIPGREVRNWNFLQKFLAGLGKLFSVECVTCPCCKREIQLKAEEDEYYNYPIWAIDYEIKEIENDSKN